VHEETGLTVEKENDEELAGAIAFLIDRPETAVRMGEAGRLRASALFGLDRYVNDSDALYKKVFTDWKTAHSGV
jgi:glycosyltransferase involved in cell wall biosynthesis